MTRYYARMRRAAPRFFLQNTGLFQHGSRYMLTGKCHGEDFRMKRFWSAIALICGAAAGMLVPASTLLAQGRGASGAGRGRGPQDTLVSPEVHPDRTVTFRVRAPASLRRMRPTRSARIRRCCRACANPSDGRAGRSAARIRVNRP